eukprot:1835492-Rhodomonas_salina.1
MSCMPSWRAKILKARFHYKEINSLLYHSGRGNESESCRCYSGSHACVLFCCGCVASGDQSDPKEARSRKPFAAHAKGGEAGEAT